MGEAQKIDRRILAVGLAGALTLSAICHFESSTEDQVAHPGRYFPTLSQVQHSFNQIYENVRGSTSQVGRYVRTILTGEEF